VQCLPARIINFKIFLASTVTWKPLQAGQLCRISLEEEDDDDHVDDDDDADNNTRKLFQ